MSDVAEVKKAIKEFEKVGPDFYDCERKILDAARRWVRVVSEFPTGEDVQRTVAAMPRWMLEAIREHVGVPEDVVSVILVAAVGVEKETSDE